MSIPGRNRRMGSWWSTPRSISAPTTARNVSRGTPSQSAQSDQIRVSSTSVSPTSKTTARIVTRRRLGAILPTDAAQRRARQLLVLQPGPLVDLLDATEVEAVEQDRLDVLADLLVAQERLGVGDRHEHLGRPVEEPVRLGTRVHQHRPRPPT